MGYFKVGFAAAGVAWFILVSGALFWNFAPSPNFLGLPTSASGIVAGHSAGSLGTGRQFILAEATRRYNRLGVNVTAGMANGSQLAPVSYLNRQLEQQGAKWRVRSTEGNAAVIYEIS